ncbi:Protein of unknown function [Succinivibrio dextrinosolvens]|uniref:DUF3261 domain-containing protein n=1 Tax=Succinivibrio dextrinosolvens TaxID=83771 RepID=UPI0008EC7814|nr:DUF3261 domain-containing protein [Succinivibrio dextrinosolvens]SFS75569.1 Protein of unknown function [Succinivibrio dextrinosolvens]
MQFKIILSHTINVMVIPLMLFCFGCSSSTKITEQNVNGDKTEPEYINIEKDAKIPLPFISFESEKEYRQILTADYNGKKNSLLCIVKLNQDGINLTGLTLSSLPLFNLKYEKQNLQGKYYVPKSMLPPVNQVLFDIMLAFDGKNRLSEEISKEYIIHRDDNAVTLGKLDGKELYSIKYAQYDTENLPVKIVNHEFNYSINLEYLNK